MALTALFALMKSVLFTQVAVASTRLNAPFRAVNVSKLAPFALQLNDLDTGLGNEIWFLAIIVVVAIGAYIVYRGPKHM
jgi:hypothetical protein